MSSCCCCLSASAILSSSGTPFAPTAKERQGSVILFLDLFRSLCVQLWRRTSDGSLANKARAIHGNPRWTLMLPQSFSSQSLVSLYHALPLGVLYDRDTGGCGSSCRLQDVVNSCHCFIVTRRVAPCISIYTTDVQLLWFVVYSAACFFFNFY